MTKHDLDAIAGAVAGASGRKPKPTTRQTNRAGIRLFLT